MRTDFGQPLLPVSFYCEVCLGIYLDCKYSIDGLTRTSIREIVSDRCQVLVASAAIRITKALRIDFFRQVLRQDVAFFESPDAPSISGHVTTNGNLINQGISERLGLTVQACSAFISAFVVALAVQWKLTLIIIAVVPANLAVTFVCVALDVALENGIMAVYSRAGALAEEAFSSMRTVHAFCAYPRLSKKFEAILDEARALGFKKSPLYAVLFSFEFFAIYAAYGLAFWQGTRLYANGEISQPGPVVTCGSHPVFKPVRCADFSIASYLP